MSSFIEFNNSFPTLMNKLEKKIVKQSMKSALNKGLKEGLKEAKKATKKRYNLPTKSENSNTLDRPSLKSQLTPEPLRSIKAIDRGIPAKLKVSDKKISLIRFLKNKDKTPLSWKRVPNKSRKNNIVVKVARKKSAFKNRFVAQTMGSRHVFRRLKGKKSSKTGKEKLAMQRLSSVFKILQRKDNSNLILETAKKNLEQTFQKELQKRIERETKKGGYLNVS